MSQPLASFYRGKRVLVTGHTGFTGGWLVAWLKLIGAQVCGYGLPPSSRPNFFDATLLDRGMTSIFADIRDRDALANVFADFQPEIVFHAAQGHEPATPVEIFSTNVMGSLNVLEEARMTGCARAIVLIGTYAEPDVSLRSLDGWWRATSAASERIALEFAECFFHDSRTSVASSLLPMLIGGGDWKEFGLVPGIMRSLALGEPILVSDNPVLFCHVLDAVAACLRVGEDLFSAKSAMPRSWAFCPPQQGPQTESDLAKRFLELWGGPTPPLEKHHPATSSFGRFAPAEKSIVPGWHPTITSDEAIGWTVDWYKAYLPDPHSARETTESQIERYATRAGASVSATAQ